MLKSVRRNKRNDENKRDSMQYTLLTNAVGRGQADILENYLRAKDIDVVLV